MLDAFKLDPPFLTVRVRVSNQLRLDAPLERIASAHGFSGL